MARVTLPMEIKSRELLGKTWLAAVLAERGHKVALGNADEFFNNFDVLRPDIYFAVGPVSRQPRLDRLSKLKECGVTVVLLDPEGGALADESYHERVAEDVSEYVDYFYAWGERAADIAVKNGYDSDQVVLTGNPRFDLQRSPYRSVYDDEIRSITDKYGEYILVNSSFGVNHADISHMKEHTQKDRSTFQHQAELVGEFVSLVCRLAQKFSDWTVVVRPHPVEAIDTYQQLFWSFDNVAITKDGGVEPWLLGAKAIIHNSCTTGIEATLADRPVFSYQPTDRTDHHRELPNLVSSVVESPADLVAELQQLPDERPIEELDEAARMELYAHFGRTENLAARTIADHLGSLEGVAASNHSSVFDVSLARRVKRCVLYTIGEEAYEKYYREGIGRFRAYRNFKFPNMTISELDDVIDRLGDYIPKNRLETAQIRKMEHSYWIQPSDPPTQFES